ncbi:MULTISPECIES: polymorphic toxin type 37 domain-containing protein [unclassified Coleofasciculus]|uniref:polymorphic toxin-type HINT domain-containing protein n=1 Tax=unclassified Coleofasciculus TaxID=2692782 RepID=UPI0018824E06|nr:MULTISPECIES: polymorphic toxin-type HINT domain-containing protein [unclassified Coleofasciculus]MBE9129647.1 hypothetical protein [Coleofasciculus sp. LEGE 07081]MBE9152169.1 hypothetical protein [Coleofasciculus sp. LEGE 07092]
MSFREPIRKKNSSAFNQTPAPNPLQPRRFKVPKPPPEVVQLSPEQNKALIQEQLERASRFGYNASNVPVNAPGTPPPPLPVQRQFASGELTNHYYQAVSEGDEAESQENSIEAAEPTVKQASGDASDGEDSNGSNQHQEQIPTVQAQQEKVPQSGHNFLKIPVYAPGTSPPPIQRQVNFGRLEKTFDTFRQPSFSVAAPEADRWHQLKVQQFSRVQRVEYPSIAGGEPLQKKEVADGGGMSVDVSQPQQAEPLTSNPQAGASESTEAVESIVAAVVESLQTDPEDSSGQVKRRIKSLEPATRKAVMAQLQNRIPPEQWQRLSVILAEPDSAEEQEAPALPPLEEIAPDEGDISDQQAQDGREGGSASSSAPEAGAGATEVEKSPTEVATPGVNEENTTPEQQTTELSSRPGGVGGDSSNSTPQSTSTENTMSSLQTTRDASVEPSTAPVENGKTPTNNEATASQPTGEVPTAEGNTPRASQKEQPSAPSAQSSAGKTPDSGMSTQSSQGAIASGASQSQQGGIGFAIAQNNSLPSTETQTPSTNFAGTQIVLEQVAAAANAARQRFTERLVQGTEAIAASVQQQQEALISASDQQGSAIRTLFANAREQIGQIISSAQAQLQTDAISHLATLQQGHTATLGEVETTFSSSQEQAQELGDSYAEQSLETADNSAEQVQSRLQGMAQEARSIGQEKAQVGGSTPEIAQAKAQAANEIASDTADKITSGMSDAMGDLRATGPETASSFREQGQEAAGQLGEGQGQVVEQLNTSNQETATAIQQAVGQGNQALGNLQGQLIEQLVSLEQTIQNQLQSQVAQKSQELYAAGDQAINTFQEQGQQAITSGDEHLAQFNQQVAEMDIDPELAAEATTEIVGQVDGAYNNLMSTADGALQQADSALVEAGNQVLTAISSVSSNAASQIQTFLGQAQGQVSQQVTSISDQLGTTVSQASDAESGMVSEVTSSLDEQISQLDSGFGEGLEEYTGGLDEQVTSAEEQASEPRESVAERAEEAQHRAEERAQNSWIENQWNDLVGMLSWEFLAGLVAGLLVGAFIIATFGTGAVALVAAGAIAGAVGALAATVVGNYRGGKEGWALLDGAPRNMIWGAFGGAAGAAALVFLGGGFIAGGAIGGVAGGLGLTASQTLALLVGGASVTAGLVTILDNASNPERSWDEGLLANMLLAGVFTWLGGKLSRRSVDTPESTPRQPGDTPESTRLPVEEPESTRSPRSEVDSPEQSPRGCFVAGTKVLTPEGEKTIETLTNDEAVWSLDPSSNSKKEQFIQCISVRSVPKVLDIQVGETTITCSPEHPFWVPSQGWVKAGELQIGWTLLCLNKGTVTIDNIHVRVGSFTVHNIEVNGLHNYCVSPLGVLVHNKAMRWNLQDRAAALRGRITDLLEQVRDFPEDVPERAELLRQLQEAEPEANRLARLAEESDSPDALESSRGAIESLEEQLIRLEESADAVSLPLRARSLPHRVKQLMKRANELSNDTPDRHELIRRLKDLEGDAEAIKELAADDPTLIEHEILVTESQLRDIEARINELNPAKPTEANVPRPNQKNPANNLPTGGDHPYVPPKQAGNPEIVRHPEGGGWIDAKGNNWEWAHDQHAGPHWDVQHPDGTHTNVYPDGMVHQGSDNF